METKICKKCGRELPIENYHIDNRMAGGYKSICKDCNSAYRKERNDAKKADKESTPLSKFTPRELIEELRKRGYKGKLQYVYEVVI